jgi:hypothetical protein
MLSELDKGEKPIPLDAHGVMWMLMGSFLLVSSRIQNYRYLVDFVCRAAGRRGFRRSDTFDLWMEAWRKKVARGNAIVVRSTKRMAAKLTVIEAHSP